jgi:hypothetical protein
MRPEVSKAAGLLLLPLLAACVAVPSPSGPAAPAPQQPAPPGPVPPTTPAPAPSAAFRTPQVLRMPGLERVIEQNAASLIRQFGTPRLDVREGDMRKLQFSGQTCVLDVFLYPLQPRAEPVATYVDARRPSDGADVDRAACVAALARY